MDTGRVVVRPILGLAVLAISLLTEAATAAEAQEKQGSSSFLQVNSVGGVLWSASPHGGPFHFDGALALWTSDYFRGRYGGVPADLDHLSYRLKLSGTVELLEDQAAAGPLKALSISLGNLNYFTDSPVPDEDPWYTNDRYIGLAAAFGDGILAGLTYTSYKNPFSPPGTPQDLTLTLRHTGDGFGSLQPQFKAVKAVGAGSGYLFQLAVTPRFKPWDSVTLTTPVAIGAGFDGYYFGADADTGYYAEIGLIASTPLDFETPGRWTLSAGTYITLRSDSIVSASQQYDDAGHVVPTGLIALSFVY